jgi:hypothetical protein
LDLKDKEESLSQSQKMITLLKDEYSKVIKQYKELEDYNQELEKKENDNKKIFDNFKKAHLIYEKIEKQNELLKLELEKTRKELSTYKGNYNMKSTEFNRVEKDSINKELIIKDLKNEGNKFITMIKDREAIIENYSQKILELNHIIEQKDEQLKVMINFSKEINKENKSNVQELTKQAVKTIKIFYNTINNKNGENENFLVPIKNINNKNDKYFLDNFNENIKENNCSFFLKDAINQKLFIPEGDSFINKDFLITNNFKTELLKNELFASYIREFNFVIFLKNIITQINGDEIPTQSKLSLNELINRISIFKKSFDDMYKEREKYKSDNEILKNRVKDITLYIIKLKNDVKEKGKKMNEKLLMLDKAYNNYMNNLNKKNENDRKQYENNINELNNEISKLRIENDRINNVNLNLEHTLRERDNIISKLNEQNDNLSKRLNNLRLNPNMKNNGLYTINASSPNYKEDFNINQKVPKINDMLIYSKDKNQTIDYDINNKSKFQNDEMLPLNDDKRLNNINELHQNSIDSNDYHSFSKDCIKCMERESKISDYLNEIPEDKYYFITKSNLEIPQIMNKLFQKFLNIMGKINITKENFAKISQDKKLKVSQLVDILSQVEKLFQNLVNSIDKVNKNIIQNTNDIMPIFNFISNIAYDGNYDLSKTKSINPYESLNNILDNPNENINYNKPIIANNNINNNNFENINNLIPNLIQYFDINPKIFSSSELMKYYSIYENHNILEVLNIFKANCYELKQNLDNIQLTYDTESNYDSSDNKWGKNSAMGSENEINTYKIVNQKIMMLKKFEFDYSILMELIKNYLVAFEMIFRILKSEKNSYNNNINIGEEINELYNIFEDLVFYKIDEMNDDVIFNRRFLTKLLHNHKEYLLIFYDL